MLSHALIHDGWLLGLNLEGNRINMDGATSMVEMLVTNKFVCAIKMEGNRCVKDEKGRRGLMMMKTLLGKRSVPAGDAEGMWDGVLEFIEEWRGEEEDGDYGNEGSESFQAYNEGDDEEDEGIMSPSGLKFGESFVDDDEEEEGGGEADVNSLGSEIVKLEASEVGDEEVEVDVEEEQEEEEDDKPKKALKKKKGKKKKKKTTTNVDKKLNLNMSIPRLPQRVGGRSDIPGGKRGDGRISPDAPPVSYLSMEPEDFEKALFGPGSKRHGKGIKGVVAAGAGAGSGGRSPKKRAGATAGKGKGAVEGSAATTVAAAKVKSPVAVTKKKKVLKKKKKGVSSKDILDGGEGKQGFDMLDSGDGDDQVILEKIEGMIQSMSKELSAMEKQAGKKRKGGKAGGKGQKDGLIQEISNQVAVRLKEIWEEE